MKFQVLTSILLVGVNLGQTTAIKEGVEQIRKEVITCLEGTTLGESLDKVSTQAINQCGLENVFCILKFFHDNLASIMEANAAGIPPKVTTCLIEKIIMF